jgi:hypothetical protein
MKTLMMTLFVACVAACAQGDDPSSWTPEDPSATPPEATASDALSAGPTGDVIQPRASCSIVQFCNAPGADGTRCLQQGCSLTAAQNECTTESINICGTPVCPWIFVASDGTRFINTTGRCR